MVDFTITSREVPSRERVLGARDLFASIEYPALMHCKSGADRAGIMSVFYAHFRLGLPIRERQRPLAVAGGRAVAAHARDQAQAQDRQPTAAAPTPRQLQSLGALLQRQDLDALDHYGELAAGIRQLAGVESEAALRDAVQSLDFARAQRLLDAITPLAAES